MLKCFFLVILLTLLINTTYASYLTKCGKNVNEVKNASNNTEYNEIGPPLLYHDVGSVLELLQKPEYKNNSGVQGLLEYYRQAKVKKDQFVRAGGSKKYPLIVLEGMRGTGKTTVANAIAKKINSKEIHCPPPSTNTFRLSISNNSILNLAYHTLGTYIAGLEVHQMLNDSPVVLDRYWHSCAIRGIATAVSHYPEKYQFPPEGDEVYSWPRDLLKPDLVMWLSVDEDIRQQRLNRRDNLLVKPDNSTALTRNKTCPLFLTIVPLAVKRMRNPEIVMINGNPSLDEVLAEVYSKMKPLFRNI